MSDQQQPPSGRDRDPSAPGQPPGEQPAPERAGAGDLGRRLAHRRRELGLTREDAAARAGMAPDYLRYLEESAGATPGTNVLLRLADVLRTTVTEFTGGAAERPPGQGQAAPHPAFTELSVRECRALLASHGVGRLAVNTASGPVVVPVNYSVVDGSIVFRTAPGTTPALAVGSRVAFEVDRVDEALSEGWSVLVRGHARAVTDPGSVRRLTERAHSEPWAGGVRELWIRVDPTETTGRRITV
ncbi:helix-turn-helix domain-containing protein [Streptomyces sp. NBC_00670]|jgi:nitroimidazol reductase NimA-like FMN-containing flavoprotein (pyridoxamine 5'-phosphate oxidase superfamily)|uniref:helix-turn-helix domain-containing protein n=1 Tax=Streptomyces sp. NBC_00670 TaxID=2975804 RepID=UPI002E375A61|nr:pyridoxamine 5'-phosphate oxidase family protein [Streptomyces sp. NBC_00670]